MSGNMCGLDSGESGDSHIEVTGVIVQGLKFVDWYQLVCLNLSFVVELVPLSG